MTTVGELKRFLEKRPDNEIVVLAMDEEGNRFSTLEEAVPFAYDTEDETIYEHFDVEDDEHAWLTGRYVDALVLWP